MFGTNSLDNIQGLFESWWHAPVRHHIDIVGRGRWSRVWRSVVESHFIRARVQPEITELEKIIRYKLHGIHESERISIITNATKDHFTSAKRLLRSSHLLVEKPVACSFNETKAIMECAQQMNRVLFPGHSFLFASYLHEFKYLHREICSACKEFIVEWSDPEIEIRHGEIKKTGYDTPLVTDLWPHIDALLRILFSTSLEYQAVASNPNKLHLELDVKSGNRSGRVIMAKNSSHRKRVITLLNNDQITHIDFSSTEPASAFKNDEVVVLDTLWKKYSSPLGLQLGCFLEEASQPSNLIESLQSIAIQASIQAEKANSSLGSYDAVCRS